MLSHKNRYTVATLFFFASFLLSIFFYFLFSFSSTTLYPPLSHHADLYLQLQLQPSPLPASSPPPHQPQPPPPPPPPPHSSPATITAIQPPPSSAIAISADQESVTVAQMDSVPSLNKECDLYTGTWVEDKNYPIYQPSSCPYVDEAYDCYFNGRTDTHYTKWRWKPHSCDIPRFLS